MGLAMDIDVLADDYLVRFIVEFQDDDIQKIFLEKTHHKWFETSNVHDKTRIGPHNVDHAILAIEEAIRSLQNKTTSEIFHLANTTHHPFFIMTTIPLDD